MDKHINYVCLFLLVAAVVAIADDEEINVCDSGGMKCSANCTQFGICLDELGDNVYTWNPVRTCNKNEYCSCVGQSCHCIGEIGSCVPNSPKITCVSPGLYPDLYDCKNYLWCDPHSVNNVAMTCDGADSVYDACTGLCDVQGTSCSIVPPICKGTEEIFQLKSNNRIYFYCAEDESGFLHPVMGRCNEGFFDPSAGKCIGEEESGCIMGDTSNTVTPTSATHVKHRQ